MQDKLYILRKLAVVTICILVFFVVGLSVVTCQSKEVVVNYYGKDIYIKTMSNTIEGMLMQNNIYIDDTAIVYPSRDSFIKDNMQIMIYSENTTATINLNEYKELAANKHTEKYFVDKGILIANAFPLMKNLLLYYFAYGMRNISDEYGFSQICKLMKKGFKEFKEL